MNVHVCTASRWQDLNHCHLSLGIVLPVVIHPPSYLLLAVFSQISRLLRGHDPCLRLKSSICGPALSAILQGLLTCRISGLTSKPINHNLLFDKIPGCYYLRTSAMELTLRNLELTLKDLLRPLRFAFNFPKIILHSSKM